MDTFSLADFIRDKASFYKIIVVKMDIEGAEAEAIIGATELIKTSSPVLAICLYHKPKDLWELPLLINEINPNYDMYLRLYGSMGLELVLYCVPKAH